MGGTSASPEGSLRLPRSGEHEANGTADDSVTIGEFISDLNVKNNAERIAAIALFMDEQQDQRLVPKEDFPSWFQRSGEAPPKNLIRDLQTAVARRLVSEDHSKAGYYFVTKTGTDLLRGTGGRAQSPARKRTSKRTTRKSSAGDDDDAGAPAQKRVRRNATATGKGLTGRILALKAAGWLDTPRTLQDILSELARRGGQYKRTDLTRLMITLVGREDLARSKKAGSKGDRKVWHYSAS
ncbi:MAG: hypothetical protein M3P26_01195 [Gemmatimonadota bacterium]|nr:hypothetical protein [Gemmatimonadota bacterium]